MLATLRPSRSRPDQGLIKVRTTTLNQNGEVVQVTIGDLVVPRRPTQDRKEIAHSHCKRVTPDSD